MIITAEVKRQVHRCNFYFVALLVFFVKRFSIAVITVEPTVNYSFVLIGIKTRRAGQYIYLIMFWCVVSLYIFTSCAVFLRVVPYFDIKRYYTLKHLLNK